MAAMPLLEQQRGLVADEAATLAVTEAIAQLQLAPPTQTTPISPPGLLAIGAAVSVLTNAPLLSNIGSFQEDPLTFVTAYKMKMLGPEKARQVRAYSSGLVRLAIKRGDLHALKMIYTARHLHPEAVEKLELSFLVAMDVAVCEGQKHIIQWLHARSRAEIESTPAPFALLWICGRRQMDVVRFLFDLHDDRIDQRFLSLLKDVLRPSPAVIKPQSACDRTGQLPDTWDAEDWGLLLLEVFVQQRPALHDTLLTLAAEVGSVSAVSYMLSPRSGVDTARLTMLPSVFTAGRGGYCDLVEMLFAAKRPDEVISSRVLHQELSGVVDAGTLQFILSVAAPRNSAVQSQRNAVFGFKQSTLRGPASKRKTTGRTKASRR